MSHDIDTTTGRAAVFVTESSGGPGAPSTGRAQVDRFARCAAHLSPRDEPTVVAGHGLKIVRCDPAGLDQDAIDADPQEGRQVVGVESLIPRHETWRAMAQDPAVDRQPVTRGGEQANGGLVRRRDQVDDAFERRPNRSTARRARWIDPDRLGATGDVRGHVDPIGRRRRRSEVVKPQR